MSRASAHAKWNVIGRAVTLSSPRGSGYGTAEVRLDGRALADGRRTIVLLSKAGHMPVDCLEVAGGR